MHFQIKVIKEHLELFNQTITTKYTRASVFHKARISVDNCGDVDGKRLWICKWSWKEREK